MNDEIESDEENEESAVDTDAAFVERAIAKAGTATALAKFTGVNNSSLGKMRSGRMSLSADARNRIAMFLGEGEETAVGEDPSSAESRAAWVARKPAPAEEAPQAKPVVTRRALAPAAPKTVRLELEAPTARELYLLARSTGRAELALVLSDALLAEVA